MTRRYSAFLCVLGMSLGWQARLQAAEPAKLDPAAIEFFEKNIRPLFAAHCVKCHGPEKQKGGFRLDSQAAMMAGGSSGAAMVIGKPDESRLVHAVRFQGDIQMPPGKKLSDAEIAAVAAWVKMGAPWPTPSTETRPVEVGKGLQVTAQDRAFWSFQPVKDPPLPAVKNAAWVKRPLDQFILAQLESKGLEPTAVADRHTLVRRAYFDLIGLPPSPEEVAAALSDTSDDWFAKVVDHLLASPHYGERWARHWLDVARYGEDQAHTFAARLYPYGFHYRDWVVKALNDDMPYDRFIREQIAADLIDGPNKEERLAALGFFALGPVYYGQAVLDELDDRVDTLCRGFLGLTVACARCHDHKFDPIPTRDYYSLAGVFSSSTYKEYPIADPETAAAFEKSQAAIKARNDEIAAFLRQEAQQMAEGLTAETAKYIVAAWKLYNLRKAKADLASADFVKREKLHDFALERWMAYLFPKQADDRPHLSAWRQLLAKQDAKKDLTDDAEALAEVNKFGMEFQEQVRAILTKSAPDAGSEASQALLKEIVGGLFNIPRQQTEKLLVGDAKKKITDLKADLEKLKKAQPKIPFLHSLMEGSPKNMRVHLRGNPATLGDEAPRHFLSILSKAEPTLFNQGSGRLELANAIASKDNPLTARVMVNRLWMHHFVRGLVGTPSNFGSLGERPTHPELLDHLATRFMANGWSIKAMHREIMLSAAYQMSSRIDPQRHQIDPDNKLLWRMNRRRLEVEAWRDAMLTVAGTLDRTVGGPSFDLSNPDQRRRTFYAAVSRHNLDPLLRLFDFPDPNLTSDRRPVTTVPLQQLFVLNSEFMARQARALNARLGTQEEDDGARIQRAFTLVYGRPASAAEIELGRAFLKVAAQPLSGTEKPKAKQMTAWERYAQVLLSANEFMFVD